MNDILIIEQKDYEYTYFMIDLIIILITIMIYVFFLDVIVDRITNSNCVNLKYLLSENNKSENKKEFEKTKITYIKYMLIFGLLSIIAGSLLIKSNELYLVGIGIIAAGGSVIISNMIKYIYVNA